MCFLYLVYMTESTHTHRLTYASLLSSTWKTQRWPRRVCRIGCCVCHPEGSFQNLLPWRHKREKFSPLTGTVLLGDPLSSRFNMIFGVRLHSSTVACQSNLSYSVAVVFKLFQHVLEHTSGVWGVGCGWEVARGKVTWKSLRPPSHLIFDKNLCALIWFKHSILTVCYSN